MTPFPSKRITDYWPEFGQNGKEKTTIADLMRHEVRQRHRLNLFLGRTMNELKSMNTFIYQAGLPNAGPMAAEDCLATNIRKNKVSIFLTFSGDFNCPPPAGEGDRRLRAGVAERGEASVPCNQQAILFGLLFTPASRGWIANEVFRRVHPEGATIGSKTPQSQVQC